ncbi:beta-carotene 15,15'-dioxygenase, Brp/Blh family [Natronolimnobius sp. AArcel1]|uniref:Brp/Blh family beta-carotene 15,15'-dioxygenase n=1 Tax=Natronolimnobius sp. AArcel1 TaxID=1679093 RepID=UPI0013ED4A17|nr:Brp/Blh family beta-carotene 15,15'-dioxygenase [Natronolimnobius sp. AArcel1]NGM67668.1 beta-carotene 15,15'-dioxygenase, Brp/Blh family [Natronolimnobius sp. AArcel1]
MVLGIGVTLAALVDSMPLAVQAVPLAASVLILGLPHGAIDHLVLPRARGEPVTRRSVGLVCSGYLVLAAGYVLLWLVEPVVAFVGFILLTVVHWGQGDVFALLELLGTDHLETRGQRLLALCVRGGIPMFVPLVAFPDQYAFVATAVINLFEPATAATLEPAFDLRVRAWVAMTIVTLVVTSLVWGLLRMGPSRSWLLDAGETVGLLVFFAVVPPILAIGLYFAGWHSVRHILRTMLVDTRATAALERRDIRAATWRFTRDATPLTAGALIVLGGLALAVPQTPATPTDLLGLYLVCLAILTLPHTVIVSLLDREQNVWA